MRARMAVAGVVVACSALLAACGNGDEPAGLDAASEPTSEPMAEPTAEATEPAEDPEPEATEPAEPVATFTQPYLPEESVVELRDEVPIDVPADATDDEADVIRAYGRYYAVAEQQLQGVPFDEVDAESVATGDRLESMREYAEESVELERVVVGPPVEIHLLSLDVQGGAAKMFACVDTGESLRVANGLPSSIAELIQFETDLVLIDGSWKVERTNNVRDEAPCEELVE
jgi:predicted small secreted protein